jgi:uncharacterized protein
MSEIPRKGQLSELSEQECLDLLASSEVGRLAVVSDGQPLIFPVNYVLDGSLVVFRNDPGTKLTHATLERVALEVDEVDLVRREGWSVLVTGTGREITDAMDATSLRELELPVEPFAEGERGHWVRIVSPTITGRRITHLGATSS